MIERRVVARGCLPSNLPLMSTAVAYLLLDHFAAPGWAWGAVGLFFLLLWIGTIWSIATVSPSIPKWESYEQ